MTISSDDQNWIDNLFMSEPSTKGHGWDCARHFKFMDEYKDCDPDDFLDILDNACNYYGRDIDDVWPPFMAGWKKSHTPEGEGPYDVALREYVDSELDIPRKHFVGKGRDIVKFAYELSKLTPKFFLSPRKMEKDFGLKYNRIYEVIDQMIDRGYIKLAREAVINRFNRRFIWIWESTIDTKRESVVSIPDSVDNI